MKKSTFLFLKLFVIAGVLTSSLTMLPYTHTVLGMAKDKIVQTFQMTGDLNQPSRESTDTAW